MKIKILPAGYGDAILVQWKSKEKPFNILIDGGIQNTYTNAILPEIKQIILQNAKINLLVTTHIDYDHITGVLKLVNAIKNKELPLDIVKKWWFNGGILLDQYFHLPKDNLKALALPNQTSQNPLVSLRQGATLEDFLTSVQGYQSHPISNELKPVKIGEAIIHFLSPDLITLNKLAKNWHKFLQLEQSPQVKAVRPDYGFPIEQLIDFPQKKDASLFNASSIAFLLEYKDKSVLFLADATPEIYLSAIQKLIETRGIQKLKVDFVKLSHHGSKYSFHSELLKMIDCQHFIISTDGSRYALPNKSTLAKIILSPYRRKNEMLYFYFNYDNPKLRSIFKIEQERHLDNRYKFECIYPQQDCNGLEINI